jgi:hypothetical protein
MTSLLRKSIAAAGLALTALAAQADPVPWTLNNVTFNDGGSASGWFTFDVTQWNVNQQNWGGSGEFDIQTTAGSQGLSWHYNSTDGNNFASHIDMWDVAHSLAWAANGAEQPWIDFIFATGLTDAGGTVAVVGGWEGADLSSTVYRQFSGATVTTNAANALPEPDAPALVGAALLSLCVTLRKRRLARAAARGRNHSATWVTRAGRRACARLDDAEAASSAGAVKQAG